MSTKNQDVPSTAVNMLSTGRHV